jgi:hypothetical protein
MVVSMAVTAILMGAAGANAQVAQRPASEDPRDPQQTRLLKDSRYRIGQIERVLEGAVEHGATIMRDRLQTLMPADMLLTEEARARGFRLEGYGVFFDVEVPSLEGTLPWVFQTLDQNDLTLDHALRTLRSFVQSGNDVNLQQALKRIELQMAPVAPRAPAVAVTDAQKDAAAAAPGQRAQVDSVLQNPNEAYRTAIREALVDAMLEHTRGLGLGPNELLTVAARRTDNRPRLARVDQEAQTVLISVRGSDLTAFLGGQISREEAIKRVSVRVF